MRTIALLTALMLILTAGVALARPNQTEGHNSGIITPDDDELGAMSIYCTEPDYELDDNNLDPWSLAPLPAEELDRMADRDRARNGSITYPTAVEIERTMPWDREPDKDWVRDHSRVWPGSYKMKAK
ncbi:hypothetical protein GF324_12220 [bacterium]|nr:hypothetical protein [bacterium]